MVQITYIVLSPEQLYSFDVQFYSLRAAMIALETKRQCWTIIYIQAVQKD